MQSLELRAPIAQPAQGQASNLSWLREPQSPQIPILPRNMRGALETQEQAFRPLSRQRYGERRPEIKIDPPTKFSGKKENLPNFIFSIETYLQAK